MLTFMEIKYNVEESTTPSGTLAFGTWLRVYIFRILRKVYL